MENYKITASFPSTTMGTRTSSFSFGSQFCITPPKSRPNTVVGYFSTGRPMNPATGYRSSLSGGSTLDLQSQSRSRSLSSELKTQTTIDEKIVILEKRVRDLIEKSCLAKSAGDLQTAFKRAKEAGRSERALVSLQEKAGRMNIVNIGLTYSVLLNLANQYESNEMYTEALSSYQIIVKNKKFTNGGFVRVNMGNIYFKLKNYTKALKFYRMALDTISNEFMEIRMKIMQNIGLVFAHTGQYSDAIESFEHIMTERPNIKTGFNLILCYYAIGDTERMKTGFQNLTSVTLDMNDGQKYMSAPDDFSTSVIFEGAKNDKLYQMGGNLKALANKYIVISVKLIAPVIETSLVAGLDWCLDILKATQHADTAHDLEITKAVVYLGQRNFNLAEVVETLSTLEKKESSRKGAAATNLSSLYFLEKDYEKADRYSDLAMDTDSTNPAVLVNKGNTTFIKQDYKKAAEFYREALKSDSSSTEALYNLGLSYKKMKCLEDALECFLKLHAILRNSSQVMYQLANLFELLGNPKQAIKWLTQVISLMPTDPKALAKVGELYECEGDESQALQYYYESFRCFPSSIDVVGWLAAYYNNNKFFQKAIHYFQRATFIQPLNVQWQLLVAICYKKSGNYQKALDTLQDIHHRFPKNIKCLQILVKLCTDMELKESKIYATRLKKVEKMQDINKQFFQSDQESHVDKQHMCAFMKSVYAPQKPLRGIYPKIMEVDPLGTLIGRPKIGAKKHKLDVSFTDVELKDDLLP